MQPQESKTTLPTFTVVKRGISYRRVSTDEQADRGFSLPTQLKEIQAYAAKNGIELVNDFYDDYTGSSLERPGLDKARAWLKGGLAEVIICLDSDRLTREPIHYMLLRDELNSLGVELHYAKRGKVDLNDFGQMLVEDFYGRFAQEWKRKLIEATTRGRRGMAEAGNVVAHGRAPFGYRLAKVDGKATLVIYEPEAEIVRLIFRLYVVEEMSINGIARYLTGLGLPTRADLEPDKFPMKKREKGQWSRSTICYILNGEVYRGNWVYGKTTGAALITVRVPAIVDNTTWETAQEKLGENKALRRRPPKYEYLLARRSTCDHCKTPIAGRGCKWQSEHSSGVILYYRCPVAEGVKIVGKQCSAPTYRVDKVDLIVWGWVKSLFTRRDVLEKGLKRYQEEQANKATPLLERLSQIDKMLADHQRQLERLLDLYLSRDTDSDDEEEKKLYLDREQNLKGKINGLKKERRDIESRLNEVTLTPERIRTIFDFAERIRKGLDYGEADFNRRRQLINLLDVRVRLAMENGEKIAHVSCVIDTTTLPLSSNALEKPVGYNR